MHIQADGKPDGKRPLRRRRGKREDNIKNEIKQISVRDWRLDLSGTNSFEHNNEQFI